MIQLENKCQTLETSIHSFHTRSNLLDQRGLLGLVAMNERSINLSHYNHKLFTISQDKSNFGGVKGIITGKYFLEALDFDLIIKHEIKHIFINMPTFQKYTKFVKHIES